MPDTLGSITSSSTRSGLHGVEQVERLGAVAGDLHPEALALQPDGQGVDEATPRPRPPARWSSVHHGSCGVSRRRCRATATARPGPAGRRRVNVEPSPSTRLDARPRRRGWRRRGGRWPGRGRCRRSRGCGPGRPGRSARRSARGRGPGCRCRGRRTAMSTQRAVGARPGPRPAAPASEYFTRVVEQVGDGRHELAAVADDGRAGADGSATSMRDARAARPAGRMRSTASATTRRDADDLADGALAGLDAATARAGRRWCGRRGRPRSTIRSASRRDDLGVVLGERASRPAGRARRPASSARG